MPMVLARLQVMVLMPMVLARLQVMVLMPMVLARLQVMVLMPMVLARLQVMVLMPMVLARLQVVVLMPMVLARLQVVVLMPMVFWFGRESKMAVVAQLVFAALVSAPLVTLLALLLALAQDLLLLEVMVSESVEPKEMETATILQLC